ncbi:putative mucin-associated surface protein (MASP) [Trypanosoma cruzi Dm28c]|uniref:Putative mucin-associated surface protein (MASP) n=1 Tax=Trypanosoma cruzi Dm28c TaxID=1416333 RepID=V5ALU0_TRYCR|nr:putative mucin-associated surface protein (MASP) [Trypanosoma cruzi Dm28c]
MCTAAICVQLFVILFFLCVFTVLLCCLFTFVFFNFILFLQGVVHFLQFIGLIFFVNCVLLLLVNLSVTCLSFCFYSALTCC